MSNQVAIQASGLGKCYHIYDKPQDRLKQLISRSGKHYREFWALKDINFSLNKGGALGIIGRNGSGKSTLLQILCQTLSPTTGKLEINGRIAALLELGAGFNPEFSGRENVFLNGAILGFSKQEMLERFDEIAEFADIGDFINQPVKTYSSGMFVRLAFAVQACVQPDILIVDEALSVGDIFFQQKCAKRMEELRNKGTTLIFVSHDMSVVRDLCENSLYLRNGQLMFAGKSTEAIRLYFAEQQTLSSFSNLKPSRPSNKNLISQKYIENFKQQAIWINESKDQTKEAQLVAVCVVNENEIPTNQIQMAQKLKFKVLYQNFSDEPVHVTIVLRNRYDHIINSSGSYTNNLSPPVLQQGAYAIFEMDVTWMVEAGNYTFTIILSQIGNVLNRGTLIDESPRLGPITIMWNYDEEKAPWYGMFGLPISSKITTLNEHN